MNAADFATIAERLHGSTDEERFRYLREAAQDPSSKPGLQEACLVLSSAHAARHGNGDVPSPDEIALELSRGRVPRAAVSDWDTVEWLLASLAEPTLESEPIPASAGTRRTIRKIVGPSNATGFSWFWFPALGTGVAAVLLLLLWTPAPEGWAQSLQLSRGQVWRMSDAVAANVKTTIETGRVAEPLFELPPATTRRERNESVVAGPRIESPRWEAVSAGRPEFRWTRPGDAGDFEVLLVDGDRSVVWSATVAANRLEYPADQVSLEPGATYYWKVNRVDLAAVVASEYVAFRVLSEESRDEFESELRGVRSNAFLRGSVLDRHGLYTEAATAFAKAASDPHQRPVAVGARRAVRAKQGLPE